MYLPAEDALSILALVKRRESPYKDFDVRVELPVGYSQIVKRVSALQSEISSHKQTVLAMKDN